MNDLADYLESWAMHWPIDSDHYKDRMRAAREIRALSTKHAEALKDLAEADAKIDLLNRKILRIKTILGEQA